MLQKALQRHRHPQPHEPSSADLFESQETDGVVCNHLEPSSSVVVSEPEFPEVQNDTYTDIAPSNTTPEKKSNTTGGDIPSLRTDSTPQSIENSTELEILSKRRFNLRVKYVEKIIDIGSVPMILPLLKLHNKPQEQVKAALALNNIVSTNPTKAVVDAGAVPLLAELLSSPNSDVSDNSVKCLVKIALDSPTFRNMVLQNVLPVFKS